MREGTDGMSGVLQVWAKEKRVLRCEARLARIRGADMIDVIECIWLSCLDTGPWTFSKSGSACSVRRGSGAA